MFSLFAISLKTSWEHSLLWLGSAIHVQKCLTIDRDAMLAAVYFHPCLILQILIISNDLYSRNSKVKCATVGEKIRLYLVITRLLSLKVFRVKNISLHIAKSVISSLRNMHLVHSILIRIEKYMNSNAYFFWFWLDLNWNSDIILIIYITKI